MQIRYPQLVTRSKRDELIAFLLLVPTHSANHRRRESRESSIETRHSQDRSESTLALIGSSALRDSPMTMPRLAFSRSAVSNSLVRTGS